MGMDLLTPSKKLFSKFGRLLPSKVIEVRLEQLKKARSPILVTELGIVIEVRPEQPEKALSPMLVMELGIVIEVRLEQPEKA